MRLRDIRAYREIISTSGRGRLVASAAGICDQVRSVSVCQIGLVVVSARGERVIVVDVEVS